MVECVTIQARQGYYNGSLSHFVKGSTLLKVDVLYDQLGSEKKAHDNPSPFVVDKLFARVRVRAKEVNTSTSVLAPSLFTWRMGKSSNPLIIGVMLPLSQKAFNHSLSNIEISGSPFGSL